MIHGPWLQDLKTQSKIISVEGQAANHLAARLEGGPAERIAAVGRLHGSPLHAIVRALGTLSAAC